jgi:hypothetical protein
VLVLKVRHNWQVDVLAVPALLHNKPGKIPDVVQERIHQARQDYERVIVVYGDCGTGGLLDRMLETEGVKRVAGPHCYEMYADGTFDQLMDEAPGSFFLTDYLLGSFDHLVLEGLGLDKHPELREDYFKNYTRVVYLAQQKNAALTERAKWAAESLGLPLEIRHTGYGKLEARLKKLIED